MGQTSSTEPNSALPRETLLIDASDSYVTDLKLRSTGIIPISEYIKKDKCSKNLQRLEQFKNKKVEISKLKTEDTRNQNKKTDEKGTKVEQNRKVKYNDVTLVGEKKTINEEERKKQKQEYIETSFEDVPENRKWIPVHSSYNLNDKKKKQQTQTIKQNVTNKIKIPLDQEKLKPLKPSSSKGEIKQIYKNAVYPHIYKRKYLKKKEEKGKKREVIPIESNMYFSNTNIKKHNEKKPNKIEESTHQLNQHQYKKYKIKPIKQLAKELSVQTNIACIIHPNKNYFANANKDPIKLDKSKSFIRYTKTNKSTKEYNNLISELKTKLCPSNESSSSSAPITKKIQKATEEHRRYLSPKNALENWKNIHTLRHHRKTKTNAFYKDDNNDFERAQVDYSRMDHKMSPREISNYNYDKLLPNIKMEYISPTDIRERIQHANSKVDYQMFNRQRSPHYEYIENTSYPNYQNKYKDNMYDASVRNIMSPNDYYSHRDNKYRLAFCEKTDFINDIERCLQRHPQLATVYGRQHRNSKSTWVQDKYRRWHKVIVDDGR